MTRSSPRADGQIHLIALDAIDAAAIPRDRTAPDPAAFDELVFSIVRGGLRMPIELFGLTTDDGAPAYGLISGHRRLSAFRHLRDLRKGADFTEIPALLRNPGDTATILAAMVEENEIRASLSPWERAAIAVTARDRGIFPGIEAAIDALYPTSTRQKRAKLRNIAFLVDETDGLLRDPHSLSEAALLRLHAAWSRGFDALITTALNESSRKDAGSQWQILRPILAEAEAAESESYPVRERLPDRPRRLSRFSKPDLQRTKPRGGVLEPGTISRNQPVCVEMRFRDVDSNVIFHDLRCPMLVVQGAGAAAYPFRPHAKTAVDHT